MTAAPSVHEIAAELYRNCGRFPFHFARGKFKYDPVMTDLLACLSREDSSPVRLLDLGCGQGLLFAMLDASAGLSRSPQACASLPATPPIAYAKGFDSAAASVRWGHSMLANRSQPRIAAEIVLADIRTVDLPACDVVVLIDVLHYMPFAEQETLLRRIAAALVPRGRLVLRVGDAAQSRSSRISRWVDRVVAGVRGQGWRALWLRPMAEWQSLLLHLGFAVTKVKTYRSRWAVNVLVCGDRPE